MSRAMRESPNATIQNAEVRRACFRVRPVIAGWGGCGAAEAIGRCAGVPGLSGRARVGLHPRLSWIRPGQRGAGGLLRLRMRFGRGRSVRPETQVLGPVANEPEHGKEKRPGADPEPEPCLAPAHGLDEPLGEGWVQRHARREPEPHEAEREAPSPLEPLRDDVARAEEEAALSEKAHRREAEGEHHESVDEPEPDRGRPEEERHYREHAARPPPVDVPARVRQPEGGGEGGDPVGERDLRVAETQVLRDVREEDPEGVRLPRTTREKDEDRRANQHPAVEEPPVDAVDEGVGGARFGHRGRVAPPDRRSTNSAAGGGGGSARLSGSIRYQRIALSKNILRRSASEKRLVIVWKPRMIVP